MPLFGRIIEAPYSVGPTGIPTLTYSDLGACCKEHIIEVVERSKVANLECFIVMPNHIHMLISIQDDIPTQHMSVVAKVVAIIKEKVTKEARKSEPGAVIWQRGYHDHIVRDESDELRIREYIENNPVRWMLDTYYVDYSM